jgi:hypothetical protein
VGAALAIATVAAVAICALLVWLLARGWRLKE